MLELNGIVSMAALRMFAVRQLKNSTTRNVESETSTNVNQTAQNVLETSFRSTSSDSGEFEKFSFSQFYIFVHLFIYLSFFLNTNEDLESNQDQKTFVISFSKDEWLKIKPRKVL